MGALVRPSLRSGPAERLFMWPIEPLSPVDKVPRDWQHNWWGGWSNGASRARQNTHRYGNETGLSLPDLQIPARPAAYLADGDS